MPVPRRRQRPDQRRLSSVGCRVPRLFSTKGTMVYSPQACVGGFWLDDSDKMVDWLAQGTEEVVSREALALKLYQSKKDQRPLTVKLGVDPTAPDIHLGHTVVLEKLRQFQELGHHVVFLIGDMTARIGDPSERAAARTALAAKEVAAFAATYVEQAGKILNRDRLFLRYNSEWLGTLSFEATLDLLSKMTLARMLERDEFGQRFKQHVPIHLHELIYPLMQGYDSVALGADVELGGTDQRFNIMTARHVQEAYGQPPEVGIFLPILEGTDGVRRMGKSLGNYIGVNEPPDEMYGKVMSIPDGLIVRWSTLLLGRRADALTTRLEAGENPRVLKAELAYGLVERFWSAEAAAQAGERFDRLFREHEVPSDAPMLDWLLPWRGTALDLVADLPGMPSRSEAKRLLQQRGVTLNGTRLDLGQEVEVPASGGWIKVGKRRYYRFSGRHR